MRVQNLTTPYPLLSFPSFYSYMANNPQTLSVFRHPWPAVIAYHQVTEPLAHLLSNFIEKEWQYVDGLGLDYIMVDTMTHYSKVACSYR